MTQGSSSGLSLCLLIINKLLLSTYYEDYFDIIIFADDILLEANASYHFKELSKKILQYISDWAFKYNLKFSNDKCQYTMFRKGKNVTYTPNIVLRDIQVKYRKYIKYFGLLFDNNLLWILHLNMLKDKVQVANYKIDIWIEPRWG